MPVSKKQIKANRQNSKKSTGPKSEEGKKTVGQNATTYGLYSNKLVIDSKYHKESRVDYEMLVESLRWELDPRSCFQEYLIRKIANALWRTHRVALAETAQINKQLNNLDKKMYDAQQDQEFKAKYHDCENVPLDFSSEDTNDYINLVMQHAIPDKNFAKRILYYEMRLDRQLTRTYNLLRKIQYHITSSMRKKENKTANCQKTKPICCNTNSHN